MKRSRLFSILSILCCLCIYSTCAQASDIIATDTIQLMYPEVVSELDPNNETYVFTFKGADAKGAKWRVQIKYTAPSMYGIFEDSDFYNFDGSEGEGTYNYIRTDDGMSFFAFKHLSANVQYYADSTVIDVNGLCQNRSNQWERVLVHASVPTPAPKETLYEDLGQVVAIPNALYQTLTLSAANEQYSLLFGIGTKMVLEAGTYYIADLLKPQFVDLAKNDTIEPLSSQLVVRDTTDGYFSMQLDLYTSDDILYVLKMHTGKMEMQDTVVIDCQSGEVLENTLFDMFQFYGETQEYSVAVSVKRGAVADKMQVIPADSILLSYTAVAHKSDFETISAVEAEVSLDDEGEGKKTVHASLYGINKTLYKVSIPLGYSFLPEAKDTISIDFGEGVGRVDYTHGVGLVGFVLASETEDIDVHVSVANGLRLSGTIDPDYFNYEGCYITTYTEESTRFTDITSAQMQLDSVGDVLHITLDAVGVNDTLYHMTAYLTPKYALTGSEVAYSVDLADQVDLIALTADSLIYRMQLQRADQWTEEYEPLGNVELWNFRFLAAGRNGIAGTYGYNAGDLDDTQYMALVEDGTEIYLAPVGGTLTLTSKEKLVLNLDGITYKTHYYGVEARILAENNIIYHLTGDNILLCLNNETGELVELSEGEILAIGEALQEQGFVIRKVLRNGQLLIERSEGAYNIQGMRQE